MDIIEKLPDDIILYIYTECLKRYRFSKEGTLIKLIDMKKYSFLEKYVCRRRATSICKSYSTDFADEKKYRIQYSVPNLIEIVNRKELYIDDDMICIDLTENEKSLQYDVSRFRLKRVENINSEKLPSIYHKGGLVDYDWDVFSYSYDI